MILYSFLCLKQLWSIALSYLHCLNYNPFVHIILLIFTVSSKYLTLHENQSPKTKTSSSLLTSDKLNIKTHQPFYSTPPTRIMQLSLPLLSSLLASTIIALPTTEITSTSDLSKRDKNGWVGAFQNPKCMGPVAAGDMSIFYIDECYKWSPISGTQFIGINYGSGDYQLDNVTFFTDDNCVNQNGPNGVVAQSHYKGMQCTSANDNTHSFKVATGSD